MKNSIRREILENFNIYLPNNDKAKSSLEIDEIKFAGTSKVFKCTIKGNKSSSSIFFKQTSYPNENEFRTLKKISNLYQSSDNYRVPFPFNYINEENLLATEFIEGELTNQLIKKYMITGFSFVGKKHLIPIADKIINWLVLFEERISSESTLSFDLRNLDSKIKQLDLDSKTKELMHIYLSSFGEDEIVLPSHLINDGFHTNNIILTKDGLIVVDWGCSYESTIFTMLCSFLRKLEQKSRYFVISNSAMDIFIKELMKQYKSRTIYADYLKYFGLIYLRIIIGAINSANVYKISSKRKQQQLNDLFINRFWRIIDG